MHLVVFTTLCWLALPVKLCYAMHVPAFPLPVAQTPAEVGTFDVPMKAIKELGSIALTFLYAVWITVRTIPNMVKSHGEERQRWEEERKRWESEREAILAGLGKTLQDSVKHCAEVNARHP